MSTPHLVIQALQRAADRMANGTQPLFMQWGPDDPANHLAQLEKVELAVETFCQTVKQTIRSERERITALVK